MLAWSKCQHIKINSKDIIASWTFWVSAYIFMCKEWLFFFRKRKFPYRMRFKTSVNNFKKSVNMWCVIKVKISKTVKKKISQSGDCILLEPIYFSHPIGPGFSNMNLCWDMLIENIFFFSWCEVNENTDLLYHPCWVWASHKPTV